MKVEEKQRKEGNQINATVTIMIINIIILIKNTNKYSLWKALVCDPQSTK